MGKRSNKDELYGRKLQERLIFFALACFMILVLRLISLQILRHGYYASYAENNKWQDERIAGPRGIVEDINGVVLVDNVPRFEITIPWKSDKSTLSCIRRVVNFFSFDSTAVLSRFETWKKRNAGAPFPVILDANKIQISAVTENSDIFPDLRVQARAKRRYRFGQMAAHMLGYVGEVTDEDIASNEEQRYLPGDLIGKVGLEKIYEKYLRGRDGKRVIEVDASGKAVGEVRGLLTPPVRGRTIRLTIDAGLQMYLEELLSKWGIGAAVVMNVYDGSIVAAASLPEFDPNSFAGGINQAQWDSLYNEKKKPLFNRAWRATYPPGSTLKVITAFAALEYEIVTPSKIITYCTGAHRFGNRIYRCWKEGGHGYVNLYDAIVQSCDSYFFQLGENMDVDELSAAAKAFGLGKKTGLDLFDESPGLVPDRKFYDRKFGKGKWTQGYVLNNVIGQGEYLVTVLQMCRVGAALGNGGYLVKPHVIDKIEDEQERSFKGKRIPGLSNSILAFLQKAVKGAVRDPDGTAHASMIDGLSFAGKTGTAQNPHGEDHAWFVSYAPTQRPEIAMAVLIENAGHGASVAAPIARDFYRRYFFPDSSETISRITGYGVGGKPE